MTSPTRIERHRRIAEAVRTLVAEQGLRLSMEAVAARAGCSKQTLYTNYGSKQELVRRVIIDRLDATAASWDASKRDLRSSLLAFATDHLEHLADPNTVAARRLILAETQRYAEEASALFELAVEGLQRQLTARLHAAIRQGQLREDDPESMAEMLLAMIAGLDVERRHFGPGRRDSETGRADWAAFAVDSFLRAFAP